VKISDTIIKIIVSLDYKVYFGKAMCELLSEWSPSDAAIDLIRLNGISDEQISKSVNYLKNQTELNDINDVEGYDNWNSFFIMFCIKANTQPVSH